MNPVSVIIPTFNRANIIERTIASVLAQDYPEIEIIVVDDGSIDATDAVIRNIIERNSDDRKQIRYYRQANLGACVARNRGMMLATGRYIMFLDSDDLIVPAKLSTQVRQIEADNSQCSICDFECIDAAGNVFQYTSNDKHPHDFIRSLTSPSISTVLMRRDSILPGLQWNAQLKRIQDIDFIYKYFATISRWSYINRALFRYNLHDGERISDTYKKGVQYHVLRDSFGAYLFSNKSLITTDPGDLFNAYACALRKHQFKNALASITPVFLKKIFKYFTAAEH